MWKWVFWLLPRREKLADDELKLNIALEALTEALRQDDMIKIDQLRQALTMRDDD